MWEDAFQGGDETTALKHASGSCTSDSRRKRLIHKLEHEIVLNFFTAGLRPAETLGRSNYQTACDILSCHPKLTNKLSDISRLQHSEVLFGLDVGVSGAPLMFRLELKSVGWMMDLVA